MADVRRASSSDAERMVELVRLGFSSERLDGFIYGCRDVVRYVEQLVECGHVADTQYWVLGRERIDGMLELRRFASELFLNYVAVDSSRRGGGLARTLLREALVATMQPQHETFALDVFDDNTAARTWYESLGMTPQRSTTWTRCRIRDVEATPAVVIGFPQAQATLATFGFGAFTMRSGTHSYQVGLLGDNLVRITDRAAVESDAVHAALRSLVPGRDILALVDGAVPGRVIATSLRMQAPLCEVISRLTRHV